MRTRDIKKGVTYATADGKPVIVQTDASGEIHSRWQRHVDGTAVTIVDISGGKPAPEDPWKKSVKSAPRSGYLTGRPGLRVQVHQHDGKGRVLEAQGREQVMDAKELVGTWKDFVTLHPDVVKNRYDKAVQQWLSAEFQAHIEALNQRLPDGVEITVSARYSRKDDGTDGYRHIVRLAMEAEGEFDSRDHGPKDWALVMSVLGQAHMLADEFMEAAAAIKPLAPVARRKVRQ